MNATAAPVCAAADTITINIGDIAGVVRTDSLSFRQMLLRHYHSFISTPVNPSFELDVELLQIPDNGDLDADLEVRLAGRCWQLRRGDFSVVWDPTSGKGKLRQTANPYSIDTVLRILHSFLLVGQRGFLLHAASTIRRGRAYVFTGLSGAGKTTISRLAPPDVTLLSDEVSYLRPVKGKFHAYGTPFSGELRHAGKNCAAPVAAVYLLDQGPQNFVSPVTAGEALRALMRNVLFFADSVDLTGAVFQSACDFASQVPIERLTFVPDESVWEMIG